MKDVNRTSHQVIYHGPTSYYRNADLHEQIELDTIAQNTEACSFLRVSPRKQVSLLQMHLGKPVKVISTAHVRNAMQKTIDYLHQVNVPIPIPNCNARAFPYFDLANRLEEAMLDLPPELSSDTQLSIEAVMEDIRTNYRKSA